MDALDDAQHMRRRRGRLTKEKREREIHPPPPQSHLNLPGSHISLLRCPISRASVFGQVFLARAHVFLSYPKRSSFFFFSEFIIPADF